MEALFLAGAPALDFLNTSFLAPADGSVVEAIGDGQALLGWLVQAGLLGASEATRLKRRLSVHALDDAAAQARKIRSWLIEWLPRYLDAPSAEHAPELRRLNTWLERAASHPQLVQTAEGIVVREQLHCESASDLLAVVARQVALLLSAEDPALIKRCAGSDCVLWFVDRTKAHRRVFCSAAVCGNRAKVAAFRERERKRTR